MTKMSKKSSNQPMGQVRIIGGLWRGRKLPVLDKPGLRPTTDRIRETLFNWLAPEIVEAHCLDCFAGSGVLGLEALSRYAASTTLLELDKHVAQQLKANVATLKAANAEVINTDTLNWLKQSGKPFDIVFIDPPFRKGLLNQVIELLEINHWLTPEALIYVECEVEQHALSIPTNWQLYREQKAGQVSYRLYQRTGEYQESLC